MQLWIINERKRKRKRRENNEEKKMHLLGWDWFEKTLLERNLQERKIRRENGFCERQRKVLIFIYIYIEICIISCQYILGMEMIFGGTQMEIIANNKQNQTFLCTQVKELS